jgi:hypothetical protein
MAKFAVPQPGSTITVTTRYANHYYKRESDWDDTTYENVPVLPPQSWTKPHEFCIPAENEPFIKFRTISIEKVIDLVVHEGSTADTKHGTIVVPVAGSGDKIYSVVVTDGIAKSCDCLGYQYRKNCRHLRIAVDEHPVNPRRETAKKKAKKKKVTKRKAATRNTKITKAEKVRNIIRKRKAAMKNQKRETVALVQDWCITETVEKIGFDRGLAKRYVMNNWEKA